MHMHRKIERYVYQRLKSHVRDRYDLRNNNKAQSWSHKIKKTTINIHEILKKWKKTCMQIQGYKLRSEVWKYDMIGPTGLIPLLWRESQETDWCFPRLQVEEYWPPSSWSCIMALSLAPAAAAFAFSWPPFPGNDDEGRVVMMMSGEDGTMISPLSDDMRER